ncbi:hypothetical protein [Marinobacter sp. SS21]|uniref:hypothetical protein n=1 Tax=Marinobacter sp. SS21 TaxID=2979460 RepID=UPI00232C4C60|nr:hypothetical protein [Marinobacter sp. SS21]MDC0664170.1 hypothetical protein [Marinobacter sp. SS21]
MRVGTGVVGTWIIGVLIGALFGLIVGLLQHFLFSNESYIAETRLIEPLAFDEFWDISPPVLQQAEMIRPTLSQLTGHVDVQPSSGAVVTKDLVNAWMRYLDEVVFRFVLDEALRSASISGGNKRFARLHAGFHEGLGRREVILSVASESSEDARSSLEEWVAQVYENSEVNLQRSMASWFHRKGQSLEALKTGGLWMAPDDMNIDLDEFITQFEVASKLSEQFTGSFVERRDTRVYSVPVRVRERLIMWAAIGALFAMFSLVVYGSKSRK